MPEGDTVWLAAHRLDGALRDRPVTAFDLRVPQLATANLRGATVSAVLARGKHILMRFDTDQTLHSHLRMDGSWRIAPVARAGRVGFEVRAVIGNAAWSCQGRRVHDLALAPTSDEAQWVGHLGPDLLGPDWDADRAVRNLLAQPDRPVAEALLDQRTVAGIGNMYAAEILFLHRTRPTSPVTALPDPAAGMATAYRLLRMNRDHTAQSTTGQTRRGEEHWVYLRTGQPCLRCRTSIESGEIGRPPQQRITYWCPRCQPEWAG